jgi:hypothetical protein
MILIVILITVIILGSIGNVVSILIWKYGKMSKTANCKTYMWSLALNDLFILLVLGTEFAFFKSGYYLRRKHDWICKPVLFFGMVSPQVSAWITVIIAVERMLYVCIPLKMFKSNVKRRSIITIGCIVLFSCALNVHLLFTATTKGYNENETFCFSNEIIDDNTTFLLDAASYGIFTFLLPLILITSSNIITLVSICVWKRISKQRTRQQRSIKNITRIVISISILHCVSTLPYAIYIICFFYKTCTAVMPYINVIAICYLLNSGFNSVLYLLFGESFRSDLKEYITRVFNHIFT